MPYTTSEGQAQSGQGWFLLCTPAVKTKGPDAAQMTSAPAPAMSLAGGRQRGIRTLIWEAAVTKSGLSAQENSFSPFCTACVLQQGGKNPSSHDKARESRHAAERQAGRLEEVAEPPFTHFLCNAFRSPSRANTCWATGLLQPQELREISKGVQKSPAHGPALHRDKRLSELCCRGGDTAAGKTPWTARLHPGKQQPG